MDMDNQNNTVSAAPRLDFDYVTFDYALQHYAERGPLMLTGPVQYFPTILSRVTRFKECVFPAIGGMVFQGAHFTDCIFMGGVANFQRCYFQNCAFKAALGCENFFCFDAGALRDCAFSGVWDQFTFSPDFTEECAFEDGFFSFDLRLRINCASMGGVSMEGDVFWKFLAGMFYTRPQEILDMGVAEKDAEEWVHEARRDIKKLLIAREGKEE